MSSSEGARALQETLHILLSRLAGTMEHVKNWPEAKGLDDASIHVTSTSKLLDHVNQVITALQRVEGTIKADNILRKSLNECQIPLDLLDLLDSSKLNPDCFCRGLLREALGQLAGLRRRKLALEMLGAAVQSGLALKQQQQQTDDNNPTRNGDNNNNDSTKTTKSKKRKMVDGDVGGEDRKKRSRSSEKGDDTTKK